MKSLFRPPSGHFSIFDKRNRFNDGSIKVERSLKFKKFQQTTPKFEH